MNSDGSLTSIIDGPWHQAATWGGGGGVGGVPTGQTDAIVGDHAPLGIRTVTVSWSNPGWANTLSILAGITTTGASTTVTGGALNVNSGSTLTTISLTVGPGIATIRSGGTLDTPTINISGGGLTFAGGSTVAHTGGGTIYQTGGTINAGAAVGNATGMYDVSVGNATYNATVAGSAGFGAVTVNTGGLMNVTHGDALSNGTDAAALTANSGGRLDLQTALNRSSRIDIKKYGVLGGDLTGLTYGAGNVTFEQDAGMILASTSLPTTGQIGAASVLAAISNQNEVVTGLGAAAGIFRGALFTTGVAPATFSGTLGSDSGVDLVVVSNAEYQKLNGATFDSDTNTARLEVLGGMVFLEGLSVSGTATTLNVSGPAGEPNAEILRLRTPGAIKSGQTWNIVQGTPAVAGTLELSTNWSLQNGSVTVTGHGLVDVDSTDDLGSLSMTGTAGTSVDIAPGQMLTINTLLDGGGTIAGGGGLTLGGGAEYSWQPSVFGSRDLIAITGDLTGLTDFSKLGGWQLGAVYLGDGVDNALVGQDYLLCIFEANLIAADFRYMWEGYDPAVDGSPWPGEWISNNNPGEAFESGPVIIDIVVPEPGTMILLSLGGVGVLLRRRRRRA